MNIPLALTLGAALALSATCPAGAAETLMVPQSGFLFKSLKQDGRDYPYVVYVPRNYDPAKAWPTIMFLHGAGESGTDGLKQVIQGIGSAIQWNVEKWPFVVIFPQKPDIRDQWEQHDAAVMAMLAQARKDYNVDAHRIYLTGLSQGGHGTWVLGARHADLWAAIAPICGYGNAGMNRANQSENPNPPFTGTDAELAAKLKDMPLWAFHGEADSVVPVTETKNLVAAVQAAGGHPKMTLFPGVDHNSWDKAYRETDLPNWLLSQRR